METLLVLVPRTLLGLLFLSAAIEGFAYIFRGKEVFAAPLSPKGKEYLYNLKKDPVIWGAKTSIDLIAALMLILNFHAPLGLLLVLPSIVVIILFQFSINKTGIPVGILLAVLTAAVAGHYAAFYVPLLNMEDGRGPLASGPY